MSVSNCVTIADAVAAELNGNTFSQPFTARRMLLPEYEISELSDLKVTVVPKSIEMTPFSRQWTQFDHTIDIGIQKKISGDIDTELPGLLELVNEIVAYLRKRTLATAPNAAWIKTVNEPIYARDHLAQARVFTSVISVTYRIVG